MPGMIYNKKWWFILICPGWIRRKGGFPVSVRYMYLPDFYLETCFGQDTAYIHSHVYFAYSPSWPWPRGLAFGRSMCPTGAGKICPRSQILCYSGCHRSLVMLDSVESCQNPVLGVWRLQPASTHSMVVSVKGLVSKGGITRYWKFIERENCGRHS